MVIRGPDGAEIGRGLVAYDAADAAKIMRKSSSDIVLILGIEGRAEMVHRDDMVLSGGVLDRDLAPAEPRMNSADRVRNAARYAVGGNCRAACRTSVAPLLLHWASGWSRASNHKAMRRGETTMRKTLVAITAAAFLGARRARAGPGVRVHRIPFFLPVLLAKKDPNFKAANPYAPMKVAKKAKGRRRSKLASRPVAASRDRPNAIE